MAGLSPSCWERVNATTAVNSVRARQVVVNVRRAEVKAAQSELCMVPSMTDRPTTPKIRTQDENRPITGPIGLVGVCGDEVSRSISASALPLHLMCYASSTRLLPASVDVFAVSGQTVTDGQQEMNLTALCTPRGDPGRSLPLGNRTRAAGSRAGGVAELQMRLNLHSLLEKCA